MVSTLIKNGRIVTAVDEYTADILIEDDHVRMIGRDLPAADHTQVHDAQGLLVPPGGSTCIPISIGISAPPARSTPSARGRRQRPSAAPRPWSTSPTRLAGSGCGRAWRTGVGGRRAPVSTSAPT